MADKCESCGMTMTEDTVKTCAWYQGRCPHQPSMLKEILNDNYKARIYNLINWFRGF